MYEEFLLESVFVLCMELLEVMIIIGLLELSK